MTDIGPRISVMMPVYNGARFIGEAIESIKVQTYPHWELLVVDDGSTDQTQEIVEGYREDRLRLVRQDHAGEGAARNRALAEARGEFIGFLDADDWLLPNALADHIAYLDGHPQFGATYSDGFRCDGAGNPVSRFSETIPFFPEGDILEAIVNHPIYGVPGSVVFRRDIALDNQLYFEVSYRLATDWDFFIRLAEVTQFGYISQPTNRYRIHDQSISAVLSTDRRGFHALIQRRVMAQPYFSGFSNQSKQMFFYDLLLNSLQDQPQAQEEVLAAAPFRALPEAVQADLLRHCASRYIVQKKNLRWAAEWLEAASRLQPGALKQRILLGSMRINPSLAQQIVRVWGRKSS